MKLLLDENLPKRLKLDFKNHDIYTVWDKGWNGKKNGELLRLMIDDKRGRCQLKKYGQINDPLSRSISYFTQIPKIFFHVENELYSYAGIFYEHR